jgi:hypothetical protein
MTLEEIAEQLRISAQYDSAVPSWWAEAAEVVASASLKLDQALETNRELNRRCQVAESAASQKIEDAKREGVSLSKRFARAGYQMAERENEELRSRLGRLREWLERYDSDAINERTLIAELRDELVVETPVDIAPPNAWHKPPV